MKISLLLETIIAVINSISQKTGIDNDKVEGLSKAAGGKYWKWVAQQWFNGSISLLEPNDLQRTKTVIGTFDKYKNKLEIKDINQYRTFSQLQSVVQDLDGMIISNQKTGSTSDSSGLRILKVTDPDQLATLGNGTKWCTRAEHPDCQADAYIAQFGYVNVVMFNGRPVAQYTPDYSQAMDVNDRPITNEAVIKAIMPDADHNDSYETRKEKLGNYISMLTFRVPELEQEILDIPIKAARYAINTGMGRWPEFERGIINGYYDLNNFNAREFNVISEYWNKYGGENRWRDIEEIVLQSNVSIYGYTNEFINFGIDSLFEDLRGFPEAEEYIIPNIENQESRTHKWKQAVYGVYYYTSVYGHNPPQHIMNQILSNPFLSLRFKMHTKRDDNKINLAISKNKWTEMVNNTPEQYTIYLHSH